MSTEKKKVRLLVNPNSGSDSALGRIFEPLMEHWDTRESELSIQLSKSKIDGQAKARRAVEEGVGRLLVAGGDGVINSIGSVLIGTDVALGVIPTGSGNGFARHFGIPLDIEKAIVALATAKPQLIDVGFANDHPFFVTCSLAWDAALVNTFDKSPVRGMLPYIFAAVYEFFGYQPQPFTFILDDKEEIRIEEPQLCTIANLTQYGGGFQIAPGAKADDGQLQLVTIERKNFAKVVAMMGKVFDGTIDQISGIETRSFKKLTVIREQEGPMQLDGELLIAPAEVNIWVQPNALYVLQP